MSKSTEGSQSTNLVGGSKYVDGIHEERFDLFLEDLRSGKYKQGRGTLESPSGDMCCLGVACVRPAAEGVVERVQDENGFVSYGNNSAELPEVVADYLGIPKANRLGTQWINIAFFKSGYEEYPSVARNNTAVGFNDALDKTFPEIADAFELEFLREESSNAN